MNPLDLVHQTWYDKGFKEATDLPLTKEINTKLTTIGEYFPVKDNIFRVFEMPLNKIRVVILGQDPYPTRGDAIGYAFAVPKERKIPASLHNIWKEIVNEDLRSSDKPNDEWKTLQHWRDQGIFLLNTALTVKAGVPGSHTSYWYGFTKKVIEIILVNQPVIWVLWGKKAQNIFSEVINKVNSKTRIKTASEIQGGWLYIIDNDIQQFMLESAHPAAESYSGGKAGFFGNNHFKLVNEILEKKGDQKILW